MKKMILAMTLGLGMVAAPALQACDLHKSDQKVMKDSKSTDKAVTQKAVKAGTKTVQKKSQTSKS